MERSKIGVLEARERFAVTLRKEKKQKILKLKRQKLMKSIVGSESVKILSLQNLKDCLKCLEENINREDQNDHTIQILSSLDKLANESVDDFNSNNLTFELVTSKDTYQILLDFIEAGCPYQNNSFNLGHKYICRTLALDILHNLGLVDGVGSFIAS